MVTRKAVSILFSFFLLTSVFVGGVWAGENRECSDCTFGKPCSISVLAGDGCNSCTEIVWCENDKWFSGGIISCTLLSCPNFIEIPNPFKEKEKEKNQ